MKPSERSNRNSATGWLLTILILGCFWARAQEVDRVSGMLRGRILEQGMGIPNVHIVDLSSEAATISDADGYFNLEVNLGDTLLISAVRYQRITLQVNEDMLGASMLEIPMTPFVNQLDEVVLFPYNLSGDLDQDLSNLPVEEPVTAHSLRLPNANAKVKTQSERKLYEATSGYGLIPLNPVLNALSGRTRMLKRRLKRDRAYAQTEEVRSRYPDSLFVSDLGIPLIRIPDFMYYCEVDPKFNRLATSADGLRMWDFLRSKSVEYRKNNELEQPDR